MPTLPVVSDPYQEAADIAAEKIRKRKEEAVKKVAEQYGARGRYYSGQVPLQESKVAEPYVQEESDLYKQAAISRAAEAMAAQRVKEAQVYQTGERVAGQTFSSTEAEKARTAAQAEAEKNRIFQTTENALGRTFTTSERKAVEDFNRLSTEQQQNWQSAEQALNRKFTTEERNAVQSFQKEQQADTQAWQSAEQALGRKFTTTERQAVQDWQKAENDLNRALQQIEGEKGRELTIAQLLGYFTSPTGEKTLTLTGKETQANISAKEEEDKLARDLGYANAYEMSLADPQTYQALISQRRGKGTLGNVEYEEAWGDNTGMEGHWGGGWTMAPETREAANSGFMDFGTHKQYRYIKPKKV